MNTKHIILARSYVVFLGICVFALSILVQARRVQTIRPDHWIAMSDSVRIELRSIEAQRGNIYSSDNRLLASTLPTFNVRMDLKADGLHDSIFNKGVIGLSHKLGERFPNKNSNTWERELVRARKRGHRYHLIRNNVDYTTVTAMKTWPIWKEGKYTGGLILQENKARKTPFGKLASRTIGYVKADEKGELKGVGLEASFNEYLDGIEGSRLEQRVTGGAWVPVTNHYETVPDNGSDIITTIDVNVQDVAETALEDVLKDNVADWGTAIVMEVSTGKIKAIANLTKQRNGSYQEVYNYAIGNKYEPGSTMKLVTLASLLEDGYVNISDSIDVNNGKARVAGRLVTDSGGWSKYKKMTIEKSFEKSSNVAFTKLAHAYYGNSPNRFLRNLAKFHFNEPYGIEIEGEARPFYRRPKQDGWSSMSVSSIGFGYEIQVAPLQMLAFYNAVANDGRLMKPYLVEAIRKNGEVTKSFEPEVLKEKMLSSNTVNQLRQCLEGVVEKGGTGYGLVSEDYKSAGKTGTTKLHVAGANYGQFHIASFAGYFPAENPKYSCIVVVNKPTAGKYYGGSVAGPVFKAIADMLYARSLDVQIPFNNLDSLRESTLIVGNTTDVKKIEKELFSQEIDSEQPWLVAYNTDSSTQIIPRKIEYGVVPNVLQMGIDDAVYILENSGYEVKIKGRGLVNRQSVEPGDSLKAGQTIVLDLGV